MSKKIKKIPHITHASFNRSFINTRTRKAALKLYNANFVFSNLIEIRYSINFLIKSTTKNLRKRSPIQTPTKHSQERSLSDLVQETHSQTFNKVKKSLRPSPLLKLKACFSRQVDVVPPQPVAAKVTVLYVAVNLNLRSVFSQKNPRESIRKPPLNLLSILGGFLHEVRLY